VVRGIGQQRDKLDDQVLLLIGTVDKLHSIATFATANDTDGQIETDIAKGDLDRASGVDPERFSHLELHAVRTDFSASTNQRLVFQGETDG